MNVSRTLPAAALLTFFISCRSPQPVLPDLGVVPPFTLTAQTGAPFDSNVLRGQIWVANFFFTTCNGPCPRMTSQMHQIQDAAWKMPDVKLVSFTVDPARDTPQKLTEYATIHHAAPDHWYFLTGPQPELNHLGLDVFKLNKVDDTLQHSTRFVLVDKNSHIRGYYDTSVPGAIAKLVSDIHNLGKERA